MARAALWIKICGVTSPEDAVAVADAGADAIGLNFVQGSPRALSVERARAIVQAVGPRVEWVGVFADADHEVLWETKEHVGLDTLQLHGSETADAVARWGTAAFKAVRIGGPEDVQQAATYGGERLLVDAKVVGTLGGTGARFDWSLLEPLQGVRKIILAGGLRPENVEQAVLEVAPYGIDTASGVESAPGRKDPNLVKAFIARARRASLASKER